MAALRGAIGAHLVGSIPLADEREVFASACGALGTHLRRVPDGETGDRAGWILFQRAMLRQHPAMEPDRSVPKLEMLQADGTPVGPAHRLLKFRDDIDPRAVTFSTGYVEAAEASYASFRQLKSAGTIPAPVRFQVCLPTPFANAYTWISPPAREAFIAAYTRSILGDVARISGAVSAPELAIQFDVCQEILIYEGYFAGRPASYRSDIAASLGSLGDAVPASVELGYHLCYGSPLDAPLARPADAGVATMLANDIVAALKRSVDWLHLPVPVDRSDAAFFAPLAGLALPEKTELYLGLIQRGDTEGNEARIAAALAVVDTFGVATECGWGRARGIDVAAVFAEHTALARPIR
jgi:hypothetical protein